MPSPEPLEIAVLLTEKNSVGKLLVGALQHPEAARNRALKVNSFTTTPAEILAEFEKQTGEKWQVSYTSLPELKKLEQVSHRQMSIAVLHELTCCD